MAAAQRRMHQTMQKIPAVGRLRRRRASVLVRQVRQQIRVPRGMQITQDRRHRLPDQAQRQQPGPKPRRSQAAVAESGEHALDYSGATANGGDAISDWAPAGRRLRQCPPTRSRVGFDRQRETPRLLITA